MKGYCVIKDYSQQAIEYLRQNGIFIEVNKGERPKVEVLKKLIKKYDLLIIGAKEKIELEMFYSIETNKIIGTLSIGLDHIDKRVLQDRKIQIVNCPTANVTSVAEHVFTLILALNKRISEVSIMAQKKEEQIAFKQGLEDIRNKKLGVIGAGNIARQVMKLARAFDMEISCYTLHPEKHKDLLKQGVKFIDLNSMLCNEDIISVNIPLTPETMHLISKDKIDKMKENVTFINTSREAIVDTKYLLEKANQNPNWKVGLDIEIPENIDKNLLKKYNILITPHIAGITKQANERMDMELAKNIVEEVKREENK